MIFGVGRKSNQYIVTSRVYSKNLAAAMDDRMSIYLESTDRYHITWMTVKASTFQASARYVDITIQVPRFLIPPSVAFKAYVPTLIRWMLVE